MNQPTIEELIEYAKAAREAAYAPYSGYQVGSALTTKDGSVYAGGNVENASYGLCVCAERSAIVKAVNAGHRELTQLVVVTQSSPPAAPCGICRQTINEFLSDPTTLTVVLVNTDGERRDVLFSELFPLGFRGEHIT